MSGLSKTIKSKRKQYNMPYICSLKGPILFTAPHSITVIRKFMNNDKNNNNYRSPKKTINKTDKETIEIHHMERWTAEIALKLSIQVSEILNISPSFMIWNLFKGFNENNIDPNYTNSKWFHQSPWHKALHKFKNIHKDQPLLPLLHIDVCFLFLFFLC